MDEEFGYGGRGAGALDRTDAGSAERDPADGFHCLNIGETWPAGREAARHVTLRSRRVPGMCFAGSAHYSLVNRGDRAVRVVLRVDTRLETGSRHYHDGYRVPPGETVPVGCAVPGPTLQRFVRTIAAATFE